MLQVVVHLQEARKDVVGRVVDAYMDLDIAIIKIDPPSSLSSAKVGSSSKLRPRDPVIAMGSGIISCVHGTVNDLDGGGMHKEYIQTNCAINPGHSGGPLCNVDGEVVGVRVETVNVGKPSGVSFAIPVDFISKIIKPFQNCRTLVRPDFGWVVRNVTKENCKALKKYYPTSPKAGEGVFVEKVIVGSPADRAGIEAGYVVVDFNGQQVRNIKEVKAFLI
ncbi:hypothetical protein BT93_H3097 [Corymbia citriodora subsp. variegata]|nr:hypothetical protein BT93_H3097 [Corymbia citriodora subsp. variegata]